MSALPGVRLPCLPPHPTTPARAVRLSLTDRCDLACVYCRPSRHDGKLGDHLGLGEWKTILASLRRSGLTRVRLTGGEPLLSAHLLEVIAHARSLGFSDVSLTTNGTRLAALAGTLREAGLGRITISLDTLNAALFRELTRGGRLEDVLAGIDAARGAGFAEVKLNTVVLRGVNDGELPVITEWAWARGLVPRFIELMRVGAGAAFAATAIVSADEMQGALEPQLSTAPAFRPPDRGPAFYRRSRLDPRREVGFISGTSAPFCDGCDRVRVTASGVLRACLATNDGVDAAASARCGDESGVGLALQDAWASKPDSRVWRGCSEPEAATVSMRATGG